MKSILSSLALFSLIPSTAVAQITPDSSLGTENSVVESNGDRDTIDGGAIRDANLFHSFREFNVEAGKEAYFTNPDGIANIFSRVTGNNYSDIQGVLGVLGNANLYLINPNGILFGENARLDVNGSFFATTADSVLFKNGLEFSAANPDAPPLLTIDIPIGLRFRDNPGDISTDVDNTGQSAASLTVNQGQSLTLVGGNINLDSGFLSAPGGRVELGGLVKEGTINFNENSSLSFPEDIARGNVSLTQGAFINVISDDGGSITANANNLEILDGSIILAGIGQGFGTLESQAGDITFNTTDAITVDNSFVFNQVSADAIGNGGNLLVEAENITVSNDGQIATITFGQGNAGGINLLANNIVSINDRAGINSNTFGSGRGGNINVLARSVSVTNGAELNAETVGQGNGGNVTIRASDFVEVISDSTEGKTSQLGTFVNPLDFFVAPSNSTGKGGSLLIETSRLIIQDGSQVQAGTFGEGKGGTLTIIASESVEVSGTDGDESPSGIFTATLGFGLSDAGDLKIDTGKLIVKDGAQISSSTFSVDEGKGGNITITASESVEVSGKSANGEFASSILAETGRLLSLVNDDAIADGGNLSIETQNLSVLDGAEISSQTLGGGKAGNLVINASESVQLTQGLLRARTQDSGDAGKLIITTKRLNIQGDDAEVTASTVGSSGRGGDLFVTAFDSLQLSQGGLGTVSISGGNSGNITIQTQQLLVRDGGSISNGVVGTGRVGNLEIMAADSVRVMGGTFVSGSDANDLIGSDVFEPNEEIFFASRITTESSTLPENSAGNLLIETERLIVSNGAEITTRTIGDSPGGTLDIKASEFVEISGFATSNNFSNLSAQTSNSGDAGDITIETQKLIVRDLAQISADTSGAGKAGTLIILADDSVQLTGKGG